MAMDLPCSDRGSLCRVAPFRHPRIIGYLLLPVAFRSLSRLSSALSAKASTLCSLSLDLCVLVPHTVCFRCSVIYLQTISSHCFSLFTEIYDEIESFSCFRYFLMSFYLRYAVFKVQFYIEPLSRFLSCKVRQPPALPYRLQHSTIGRLWLNHRVRDGNGCVP